VGLHNTLTRRAIALMLVRVKGDAAKDIELLVLRHPRRLLPADAPIDYGEALLNTPRREEGIALLDEAGEMHKRLGADAEARRVQGLLRTVGVRRRWAVATARPVHGWGALTDTERRVARLIARGHANRSAAAELVVSPNAVATHRALRLRRLPRAGCPRQPESRGRSDFASHLNR
jgi:DNA-binding CsgD family transcriptional regulator